jgi:hypothetical protein
MRGYDEGYARDFGRGYDYGLRGPRQTGGRWGPAARDGGYRGYGPGEEGRGPWGYAGGRGGYRTAPAYDGDFGGGYGARGYDAGFRRGYGGDYGGRGAPRGGGWRDGGAGWSGAPFPNRVTARYNLDYVHPHGERRPVNYVAYGGDREGRIGDMGEMARPYTTIGGTSTYRGGSREVGWERGGLRPGGDYRRGW